APFGPGGIPVCRRSRPTYPSPTSLTSGKKKLVIPLKKLLLNQRKIIMEFANPNTDSRYDLTALKDQLKNTAGFAVFFAEQVRLAHGGDPNAITCVESYVYPSDNELTA